MKNKVFILLLFFLVLSSCFAELQAKSRKKIKHGYSAKISDPFDKDAITTSIKDAYLTAKWVENFDRYIKTYNQIKSLKELTSGLSRIELKSYCLKPGLPVNNPNTYSYVLGPLKGTKASLINVIISRSMKHKEIEQKYVQTLIWGIIAGFTYSDYPDDFAKKIDPLLPDEEKNKTSTLKLKDILDLPLPKEIKDQLSILTDLRKLISEGIKRYDDLECIAVPQSNPVPSKDDVKIDENCWTLTDDGYYIRPKPGHYSKTKMDIYKPEIVDISYDEKERISRMSSVTGVLEIIYDDNPGADIITYSSKNSYKINRINDIKLDGESIGKMAKFLWCTTYDNSTSLTSIYKRKEVGIVVDPLEETFKYRDTRIKDLLEYVNKYNDGKKLTKDEEKDLYELKQIEYVMKFVQDTLRFQVKEAAIEKIIRIASDASVGKFTDKAKVNSLRSGGKQENFFDLGLTVAVPGNNAQRIGITGEGSEEGNENSDPPNLPDPPLGRDSTGIAPNCRFELKQVNLNIIPAPDQLFMATFSFECNKPIKEIRWTLSGISRENGRCLNDKDPAFYKTNPDRDISIDSMENYYYTITSNDDAIIATGNGSAPHSLILRTHDYGAFGKLSVEVKAGDIYYTAVSEGSGLSHINIPYDLDDNKIADKWEFDNGVAGYSADWDEDPNPVGQTTNGDGMTNYEEYRGFYELLPYGSSAHVRLDPMKKEIFVIDDDFLLSTYTWEQASGIPVYRVSEGFVYGNLCGGDMATNSNYRWINFCRGYSHGNKFAVNLIKINGIDDPYNLCGDDNDTNYTGCSLIGPPKRVNLTIVLPDRLDSYFRQSRDYLQGMYNSDSTALEYNVSAGIVLTGDQMLVYLDILNTPRKYNLFLQFMVKQNAVHEVGHACGISHHTPEKSGEGNCPMRYMDYTDEEFLFDALYFDILTALYNEDTELIVAEGRWHFCRTRDNCWNKINVNDR